MLVFICLSAPAISFTFQKYLRPRLSFSIELDHNPTTTNDPLAEETKAIKSISDEDTVIVISTCGRSIAESLELLELECCLEMSLPAFLSN